MKGFCDKKQRQKKGLRKPSMVGTWGAGVMTHNRECPKCGKIVEWTRGELKEFETYGGIKVKAREMSLVCPEHGEFEPRAHEQLNRDLSRVMKEVGE